MAITLAQAALNTQDDYDVAVINEFIKSSELLRYMIWHQAVNPAGGGATMEYSYRRQITQRAATTRAINEEYTPDKVTTAKFSTNLAEIGGSYEIDRRIAHLGPAATDEVTLQTENLIVAANAKLNDEIINGDIAVDEDGFDGLDKALTGSTTELIGADHLDWTGVEDTKTAINASKPITEFLSLMDGQPTIMLANKDAINGFKLVGRHSNIYTKSPVEGLLHDNGQNVFVHTFDNVILVDPGTKSGTNDLVIPTDPVTGETDIYAIRIGLNGVHGVTTAGGNVVRTKYPDFATAGAVKTGEVFLENVGLAVKATRSAAVLRGLKVR